MNPHILTIIVLLANGDVSEQRIGVIDNQSLCEAVGTILTRAVVVSDPTLTAAWVCEAEGIDA